MIIDPDMPDHWKTRMLVDLLDGDELAPVYLIRLWGHCQNRKKWAFDKMPPAAVKAVCRFPGSADDLESAMSECGFLERAENGILTVVGWDEHNASLVANWENGKKGGRPKKEPKGADGNAKPNQEKTHGLTDENPSISDREDREDREDSFEKKDGGEAPLALAYLNEVCGTKYGKTKTNLGPINARMSEGATLDDVKAVIDFKHREWSGDPKMAQYLRPDTLFRPTKFPGYLAAARAKVVPKDPGHNQPGYDPDLSRATDMSGFD